MAKHQHLCSDMSVMQVTKPRRLLAPIGVVLPLGHAAQKWWLTGLHSSIITGFGLHVLPDPLQVIFSMLHGQQAMMQQIDGASPSPPMDMAGRTLGLSDMQRGSLQCRPERAHQKHPSSFFVIEQAHRKEGAWKYSPRPHFPSPRSKPPPLHRSVTVVNEEHNQAAAPESRTDTDPRGVVCFTTFILQHLRTR